MKLNRLILPIIVLSLTGCTGPGEPFESRTYGVRDSEWYLLNTTERYAAKQSYLQEESLAEQRRLNNLIREQNDEIRRAKLDAVYMEANRQQIERANREARIRQDQQRLYAETQAQNRRKLSSESLAVEEAKRRSVLTHQREQEHRAIAETQRQALATHQHELAQRQQGQEQRAVEEAKRQSLLTHQREQEQRQQLIAQEQRAIEEAKRQSLLTHQREQTQRQQLQAQEDRDIAEATRRSMETYNAENVAHNHAQNWQPNEGHLVRAGEIVMNQQRDLGRQPSKQEMQQKIQSQMGLTLAQSSVVIDELGLY